MAPGPQKACCLQSNLPVTVPYAAAACKHLLTFCTYASVWPNSAGNGKTKDCPNSYAPSTQLCRKKDPDAGPCDVDDYCE